MQNSKVPYAMSIRRTDVTAKGLNKINEHLTIKEKGNSKKEFHPIFFDGELMEVLEGRLGKTGSWTIDPF